MILPVAVLLTTALAAVLLVSGTAKVGRSEQTLRMLGELRMPAALRHPAIAAAVPFAEIALGGALLVTQGLAFTVVTAGAVLVFCVFLTLTVLVLVRHETVVCACFGGTSSRPIDRWSVARNVLFVLASLVVLVIADDGVIAGLVAFDPAEWIAFGSGALVLTALVAAALVVRGVRTRGPAAAVAPPSFAGTGSDGPGRDGEPWPIPGLEVTSSAGRAVPLMAIAVSRPTLLLLLSADCTPCGRVADRIPQWEREFRGAVDIAVLTSDSPEAIRRAHPDLDATFYYGYRSLMTAARIGGVPSALLLGTDRMVAAGPAQGSVEVQDLVRDVVSVIPDPARRRADDLIRSDRMEAS
ncbi:MauE/DoxX family redox-associated membrane protein [Herbiconiux sp.]|uniref:MauE/DoxX family redox-associated membrane protein n=1 Tax=Herbiconiux sp. TaxID=1871186 RepID=UPI0025C03AF3|nr:MauE/DoxX family redox-associated membrane protein [Herbiconiux sp.]